jgi:hypothetical protein
MPITPDDKNWTWVLERPCPECGFEASAIALDAVSSELARTAARYPALLADPRARQRPSDDCWSALEYACHVRDVYGLYDERLGLMLGQDDPLFANWDQDDTAITDRYDRQDPVVVAGQLTAAADALASRFATVRGDQWQRTGNRSDGVRFTIDTFARYFLHDPFHHVVDIENGYRRLQG